LYVREDQLVEQTRIQLASMIEATSEVSPAGLAALLRGHGITIVCTPVSITLDTGLDEPQPEPEEPNSAADDAGQPGQLVIPGLVLPRARPRTKNPTEIIQQT
jgi:hypothetical protein